MSNTPPAVHALAGALGSSVAMGLTFPLITINTREQVESRSQTQSGFFKTLLKIIDEEGIGALFSGVAPAITGIVVQTGVYYYVYETLKRGLEALRKRKMNTLESLVVGYIAGAVNCTVTAPLWLITTRLQVSHRQKNKKPESVQTICKQVIAKDGILGFWNGWTASLILCSNPAIQYMVFEQLSQISTSGGKRYISPFESFLYGSLGKLVATLITYPYTVMKSRMQAPADPQAKNKRFKISDWYTGLQLKIFQTVANSGLMFLFKDRFLLLAIILYSYWKKIKN